MYDVVIVFLLATMMLGRLYIKQVVEYEENILYVYFRTMYSFLKPLTQS